MHTNENTDRSALNFKYIKNKRTFKFLEYNRMEFV